MLPLFPDAAGGFCTKEGMAATIVHAGTRLGVPVQTSDGSERLSGHSLRATGAQGPCLARLGLDLWAIQLLGRWGSDRVKGYIREAQLASSASWAARAARRQNLEDVARRILKKFGHVQHHGSSPQGLAPAVAAVVASDPSLRPDAKLQHPALAHKVRGASLAGDDASRELTSRPGLVARGNSDVVQRRLGGMALHHSERSMPSGGRAYPLRVVLR